MVFRTFDSFLAIRSHQLCLMRCFLPMSASVARNAIGLVEFTKQVSPVDLPIAPMFVISTGFAATDRIEIPSDPAHCLLRVQLLPSNL